jgi:hypothetical protein
MRSLRSGRIYATEKSPHGLALGKGSGLMRWVGFDFRLDWVKAKHRFDVCERTQTVNVPGG